MNITLLRKLVIAGGLLLAAAPGISVATTVSVTGGLGSNLYVKNSGVVIAYFEGSDAAYDSKVSVNDSREFFPNHRTRIGKTFNLGVFDAGTLLNVELYVKTTGDSFYTGPASNNPDNILHAQVIENWKHTGRTYVGFEDLFDGGDRDYNDFRVSFSNTQSHAPVPLPAAVWLLGSGLLGLAGFTRRKAA